MTRQIIIILTLLISGCCSYDKEDFEFNTNDLKHFSSFKLGDTIYYESTNHNIDTILILNYDSEQHKNCGGFLGPRPINGKWIRIKHLPTDKWYGKTQEEGKPTRIDYQSLFWITKYPLAKKTEYSISFKDFCSRYDTIIGDFHTDTIVLNGKQMTNYYIVNHAYPERVTDSTNIERVYWTDKDGLTAYMNKGGEIWIKKSGR